MKSDDTLIKKRFRSLNDFEDIAILLEIPVELLWKILIRDKSKNYRMFKLPKKNGERTIYSPSSNLGILQKKLAYILSINFNNHRQSHGFVKEHSIVTSASEHLNKRYVLNFDLENFFESIKFRRVRHMFMAYFKFNDKVATTLANICCHPKGFLPQGAATSPIISNILAKTLDKELTKVAINCKGCHYTRYADDITFSTNKRQFPSEIGKVNEDGRFILNQYIINLVEGQGFKINEQKTRLQTYKQNQSVTGITVNEKLNISRQYIRRIRSILNCIEKNADNLEEAKKIFESKYPFRHRKKNENPDMFFILRGMISHVGHVKGKQDSVYMKLAQRFNKIASLDGHPPIKLPLSMKKFHENNTYVIESDDFEYYYLPNDGSLNDFLIEQGTGFLLKNIGLVTNAHVISNLIEVVEKKATFQKEYNVAFYKSIDYAVQQWAKLICYDINKDIAILRVKDLDISTTGYAYNESIEKGQAIELIGYPGYRKGQDIRIQNGFVQGVRMHFGNKRYEISATIYGGNSGGPVVNKDNEVVAVAVKGITDNGISPNEVIPISDVIELARNNQLFSERAEVLIE